MSFDCIATVSLNQFREIVLRQLTLKGPLQFRVRVFKGAGKKYFGRIVHDKDYKDDWYSDGRNRQAQHLQEICMVPSCLDWPHSGMDSPELCWVYIVSVQLITYTLEQYSSQLYHIHLPS